MSYLWYVIILTDICAIESREQLNTKYDYINYHWFEL